MLQKLLLLVLLIATVSNLQAQETTIHPFDVAMDSCLSITENQTTMGMIQCVMQAYDAWDAELNTQYKNLITKLNQQEQDALREAQRRWVAYRDMELEFSGLMHTNLQGTMYRIFHAERVKEVTKQRALELQSYRETLNY